MNEIIALVLGGGLAASIIEAIKFFTTRRQVKLRDEAMALQDSATAEATLSGAWAELWQTGDQWSKRLDEMLQHERQKGEELVDLVQEAASHLSRDVADPILDKLHEIRSRRI